MALLTANNLSLAFGWRPLLEKISFSLDNGDKIALLGRNGEGKSTLLNILRGVQNPDDGELKISNSVNNIAYLPQDPPAADSRTVREVIMEALQIVIDARAQYEVLIAENADSTQIHELENILNTYNGWRWEEKIDAILHRFELNGSDLMADLSGGWRRRVWLARVLVTQPQILLLDEPTNHLDLNAIIWLENLLQNFNGGVIFVTHDREFMRHVANRIWELDRGRLLDVRSDYLRFLRTREEMLHAETLENARFDKKLAQEEIWIRQGIKARRTRNEGRVRALKEMRRQRAARLEQQGKATLRLDAGERSGKQVIVAENVTFSYEQPLIQNFTDIIERGERIGLVGANGVGKTTLLKLLLGELKPINGNIQHGTNLQIAYFDQLRTTLDSNQTLRDSVSGGSDYIEINGVRKHIASYLQDFLFPPERWLTPVNALSGGERARLLLARLFSQPANVLVLDEPTNDLDVETLELLTEVLNDYPGTVLIVSHDRAFLDEVVTRIYVFNQQKNSIEKIIGGFSDWLQQGGAVDQLITKVTMVAEEKPKKVIQKSQAKKLSFKFQRELDELPQKIAALEETISLLSAQISDENFYSQPNNTQQKIFQELETAQKHLDVCFERWIKLESGDV